MSFIPELRFLLAVANSQKSRFQQSRAQALSGLPVKCRRETLNYSCFSLSTFRRDPKYQNKLANVGDFVRGISNKKRKYLPMEFF